MRQEDFFKQKHCIKLYVIFVLCDIRNSSKYVIILRIYYLYTPKFVEWIERVKRTANHKTLTKCSHIMDVVVAAVAAAARTMAIPNVWFSLNYRINIHNNNHLTWRIIARAYTYTLESERQRERENEKEITFNELLVSRKSHRAYKPSKTVLLCFTIVQIKALYTNFFNGIARLTRRNISQNKRD